MTGRYLIYTPLECEPRVFWKGHRFLRNWHVFVEVCRSLHRDGLDYSVEFNLAGETPHVLISAIGTAKPEKQRAARHVALPPSVSVERCRERVREAEFFLQKIAGRRANATSYWDRRQTRYQELLRMDTEHLRAELEYWRELELLSGQRDHLKPGLSDETRHADDEVAA
jgi:hypothetical protein